MAIFQLLLCIFYLLHLNDARCTTTRHVSGYGNRGGGFISNDRDADSLYYNNERCGWEIAVPPGATISFYFIEVELEPATDGECFDYVAVYDGADRNAPLLAKLCISNDRSVLNRMFQTTQQFGFVYFLSDSSRRNEGFRLRWSREAPKPSPESLLTRQKPALGPCTDTRFVSGLGTDQTGGYITNDKDAESLYFNGESCAWLISVPSDSTIRFYFTKIDLETGNNSSLSDCKFDFVAIYDGIRTSSPLLTRQCSPSEIGKNFYTTQQHAFIQFHTDDSVQYEGFELRWLRQGPKTLPSLLGPHNYSSHCSETRFINADKGNRGGFIANDPGPDGLYLDNEHCSWQIQVVKQLTIWFFFTEIELETSGSGECYDWVAIYDGPNRNSPLLTKQCSTNAVGISFRTSSSLAFVYFHSDNSQRFKGFKLHWQPLDTTTKTHLEIMSTTMPPLLAATSLAPCATLMTIKADYPDATHGYIDSPRDPESGRYPNNLRCNWRITAPQDSTLRFWFSKIDMEHHESCWHDWVSIYDGESNHSRILTKQCSSRAIGRYFITTQRYGFVHFRTDSSGRRNGFRLRWALNGTGRKTTTRKSTNAGPTSIATLTNVTISSNVTKLLNGTILEPLVSNSSNISTAIIPQSNLTNGLILVETLNVRRSSPPSMAVSLLVGLVVIAVIGALVTFATAAFFWHYRNEKKVSVFYLKNGEAKSSTIRNNEQVYEDLDSSRPPAATVIIEEVEEENSEALPNVSQCLDDSQQVANDAEPTQQDETTIPQVSPVISSSDSNSSGVEA